MSQNKIFNPDARHSHALCLLLTLMCALVFLQGCATRERGTTPVEKSAASPGNNAAAEMREVSDEAGRRVRVPAHLTRVITLAPNLTEIVYAVGAGPILVGNTTYCDYPPEAKAVAKVGDTLHPNIEQIIALKPQLILVSTASQLEGFTRQLDERAIAVYVTDPHDLEGVFRSISALGALLDQPERADKLVGDLRARASRVEEAVRTASPVRVFYQVSREPLYTAGRDSFITDLLRRAGGVSVTADVEGAWPRYSEESALAARPEAIIMPTGTGMDEGNREVAEALKKSPAALEKRVYGINADYLSRPGPRLVDGLEELAHALHPEAFKQ
ncbi:MAG TPA: cobalamin-binding protein [Pyrinomonadaceae bacterium]|nr:cobalamin-binding protein [Pyrinomonadaceae bacterium]